MDRTYRVEGGQVSMGEEQFRKKVTWSTFFFGILVVWVHSYNGELFLGKTAQGLAVDGKRR